MDLNKAYLFVVGKGNPEEKQRVICLLTGEKPDPLLLAQFRAAQNPDGGFPFDMVRGHPSSLMDTSLVLLWLEELNSLDTDIAVRALSFIAGKQRKTGEWCEDMELEPLNPPFWMNPRDLKQVVFSTANCGFWLAKTGFGKKENLVNACEFLSRYRNRNGSFYGFIHSTWIGASLFSLVHAKENRVVKEAVDFLLNVPLENWFTSHITWLLWCLGSAGFTRKDEVITTFLSYLMEKQGEDGGFISEDAEEFTVATTIEALKVAKMFRLIKV